jgi:transposase InsO family protein
MTQGKIERYHRSMKNILLLENYYSPDELTDQLDLFIEYYNNDRYHEALKKIKKNTMLQRRSYNCSLKVA